jgi:ABC-type spermidine/putrescine transport system permease subunit II
VKPEINAISSIFIAVVGVAVLTASLLTKLTTARGTAAQVKR